MSAQHNTTEDKSRIRALREAIDAVDAQVLTLIAKRAQLAHQIGIAKGAQGVVYRPRRALNEVFWIEWCARIAH